MICVFYRPVLFVCLGFLSAAGCAKKDFVKNDEIIPSSAVTKQAENTSSKPVTDDGQLSGRQAKEEALSPVGSAGRLRASLESVYFTLDSCILDSTARDTLASTYQSLKQQPGIRVRIEGNCDERGSAEYNLALGVKRANAARKYLTAMGIAASRLSTISYGKEKPVDPSHNEDAWKKNRRDDFVIVSK